MQAKPTQLTSKIISHLLPPDTKLVVKQIYGGQIGCLWLSPASWLMHQQNEDDPLAFDPDDENQENFQKTLKDEFISALKKHPYAFGLSGCDESADVWFSGSHQQHTLHFHGSPISCRIKVPNTQKRFDIVADGIEQFGVLMHGSHYVAYAEITDCPQPLYVGNEFREEMKEIFDSANGQFRLNQSGPSPIHPDIYIIDVSNSDFEHALIKSDGNNIYFIINMSLANQSVEDVFENVLNQVDKYLADFFCLCAWRGYLLDLNSSIHNRLGALLEGYLALGSNLFFIKFNQLAALRQQLLLIHTASLRFESDVADFERLRKKLNNSIEESLLFSPLKGYFSEHSELDVELGSAFFRTLEFTEKSISSNDVAIRTIFAALTGAAFGMAVTVLIKAFA